MDRENLKWPPAVDCLKAGIIFIILAAVFTVGVSIRNYRLSTIPLIDPAGVIQVTAWDIFNDRCFKAGEFPIWNPYTGLGQPHLASMQPAPFFPLKIFAYIVGGLNGHDLFIFVRLTLMALGAFVLLMGCGAGFGGSIFGGIAFGFGGYSLWFLNLVDVNNQVLTPFLMIAFARLAMRWSPKRYALAAALIASDMLGGHPEALFISLMFSVLFAIYWAGYKRIFATLGTLTAAGATGALIASIMLLPFAEYFPRSWNFHFKGMGFLHLWPQSLLTIFSPFFNKFAAGFGWELPRGINDLSMTQIFSLPYPVMRFKAGLPYLGFTAAAFAIIGAVQYKRLGRAAGFFLIFFLFAAGLSMGLFPFRLLSFLPPFNVMNNAKFYFCEITFSLCMLAGFAADKFMQRGKSATLIIVAALVIELALCSLTVRPYVPVTWDKSLEAKWATGLDLGLEGHRFQADGYFLFPPNLGLVNGYSDVRSSDALFPIEYFNWINNANGISRDEAIYDFYPRYFTRLNDRGLSSEAAALMDLKYVVSETPMVSPDYLLFSSGDGYYLYEKRVSYPRMYFNNSAKTEVKFRRIGMGIVEAEIAAYDAPVAFSELRYPGWIATLNGREIERADVGAIHELPLLNTLQAYNTNGEAGKLVIKYTPASFRIGLWTSITTCLFIFSLLFIRREAVK